MIIDGHAHQGGEYEDLDTILATLDIAGVDKVVLTPPGSRGQKSMALPEIGSKIPGSGLNFAVNRLIRATTAKKSNWDYIEKGNEDVFEIANRSGGRVMQFLWVNPLKENVVEEAAEKFELWKYKGIKLHQGCHPFEIKSSYFNDLAEFAATKGIPLFIHLYSRKEVLDFISISSSYNTIFILGHLIGLDLFIEYKEKTGENIFFDISCPSLVSAERISLAVQAFGAEKIVMGSDTPYGKNNIGKMISRLGSLNLSNRDRELISGGNLKRILNI